MSELQSALVIEIWSMKERMCLEERERAEYFLAVIFNVCVGLWDT